MTRVTRTRSRGWSETGRSREYPRSGPVPAYTTKTYSDTCTVSDSHGRPVVPSGFSSYQVKGDLGFTGHCVSDYLYNSVGMTYDFDHYLVSANSGLSRTPIPAPSGWYLDTVAGTNPSRPVMTPLTLLQDLVEIPRQIRDVGRLFNKPKSLLSPKEAANQFLGIKFGWLPLFEDLHQLLDLQSYILKRNKELHELYSGRGLRRRIMFGTTEESDKVTSVIPLYGPNNKIGCPLNLTVKKRAWATITWKPTSPPPFHPDDVRMNDFTRRIVLGLTVEGMVKGVWDVIPWTWLLGWFTNVGKYALANSNTVPASHSEACFMSSVVETWTFSSSPIWTGCRDYYGQFSGTLEGTRKTRIVSGALTPGFNVPFLDTSRLSVLAALFVQRTVR